MNMQDKIRKLQGILINMESYRVAKDYKGLQDAAARAKAAAQSIKAQARSTELRHCVHEPNQYCRCVKCGKANLQREIV